MGGEWPAAWTRSKLGSVADVNWGDTSVTKAAYVPHGFPAFSASGCDGYLPYHDYDRTGVVVSAIGAQCGTSWLARGKWSCIKNTLRFWAADPDVDTEFLYWLTRDPNIWPKRGSAQPFISQGDARNLEVAYPCLGEQRAIAYILGTLDDKIAINRRMSETLEAMARALFKSWFIDFDPVHWNKAARAGKPAGPPPVPPSIGNLFPDDFQPSELGPIPNGWEVGRLGDVLERRNERCSPSSTTVARPYVPIECISSKSLLLQSTRPGADAQSSLTSFHEGDFLFGAMRPYFHKVCIAPFAGTTRTTVFVLYPRSAHDFAFSILLLHEPSTIDFATRHATGSTIPYSVWESSLADMSICRPAPEIRRAFDIVVRPLLNKIILPFFENQILAGLRDALIPQLLSASIRVGTGSAPLQEVPS